MNKQHLYFLNCILLSAFFLSPTIHAEQVSDEESASSKPVKLGTTFTWSPTGVIFYDAPRFRDSDVKAMLERGIIDELTNKGYLFSEPADKVDFYLSYLMILEEKLSDDEISKIATEYPQIKPSEINTNNFEYGSFVISAATADERVKLWENSINIIVNLKMPDSERKVRINEGAITVLESFPVITP